jgi:hypothetical protein
LVEKSSVTQRLVVPALVGLTVAAAAVVSPAPAVASNGTSLGQQGAWAEPQALMDPVNRTRFWPTLTANAAGMTVATWWQHASGPPRGFQAVVAVRLPESDTWSEPRTITRRGTSVHGDVYSVALDNERVAVVWDTETLSPDHTYQMWMREVRPNGSLTKAVLVREGGHAADQLGLVAAPNGHLVITADDPNVPPVVMQGSREDGFTPIDLSGTPSDLRSFGETVVATDSDGGVTVVAISRSSRIVAMHTADGESWSSNVLAPRAGSSLLGGKIVANAAGDFGVAWTETKAGEDSTHAGVLTDQVFRSRLLTTSEACRDYYYYPGCFELGIGDNGDFAVVWQQPSAVDGRVDALIRRWDASTEAWSANQTLVSNGQDTYDQATTIPDGVSIAVTGDVVVGWRDPSLNRIYFSCREDSACENIGAPATDQLYPIGMVALSGGDATVGWRAMDFDRDDIITVQTYDGSSR